MEAFGISRSSVLSILRRRPDEIARNLEGAIVVFHSNTKPSLGKAHWCDGVFE